MCWIITKIGKDYCVGYYKPNGELYIYERVKDKDDAEELCSYLNGGSN